MKTILLNAVFLVSIGTFYASDSDSQTEAPQALATGAPAASEIISGTSEPQDFIDLAKDLRCPTCTGLSVLDSDAPFSVQIKNEVKEQMKQGKTHKEIMGFFTDRYGPWILREPPKSGANLIAWVFPAALLVVGPFLIWIFVWRRRKTFSNYGVRNTDEIMKEFQDSLGKLQSEAVQAGGQK